MRQRVRFVIPTIALLCTSCLDFGPVPGPPLPTIDGPESPDLLHGTSGTLLTVDRDDDARLNVIRLPSLERRTIDVVGCALCISGPDDAGRVAYIQTHYDEGDSRYALRCVSLVDGSDTRILAREGRLASPSWVALSPSGARAAFLSATEDDGHYTPWVLEIVDLASRHVTPVSGTIAQHRPCWFPDGRRLAFVESKKEDRTSITSILDVISGERSVVREAPQGEQFTVSADGESLFFEDARQIRRVDARSGSIVESDLRLPGGGSELIHLAGHEFLYQGPPTTGAEQKLRDGFMWPHDIKLADAQSGAFVTVVPQLWGMASYGAFDVTR